MTPPLTFPSFQVARLPEIRFGDGTLEELPDLLERFGGRAMLVTGARSLRRNDAWLKIEEQLHARDMIGAHVVIDDEPSPQLIDVAVAEHRSSDIGVVVAVGGGSTLDAGKAIAGLLKTGTTVMDHLEGVGRGLPYPGPATPLIAVPTTAGTGSEATKNAVLSQRGPDGFKKSFRDEQLVADIAIVDPTLLATCPKDLIAANGMDAFTQLLESYVSLRASPFTDALASSGMQAFRDGFWSAWEEGHADAADGYRRIAFASLCSGITLAQCGLGSVHGLASPLGAFFPIPHGVVCGTLVASATRANLTALREREPDSPALRKYAEAGVLLSGKMFASESAAQDGLVDLLDDWTTRLSLPHLGEFGMLADDIPQVVANCRGGSMQSNPIVLTDSELAALLQTRL